LRNQALEGRGKGASFKDADFVSFVLWKIWELIEISRAEGGAEALGQVAGSCTYFADGDVLLAKITPCFENGSSASPEG